MAPDLQSIPSELIENIVLLLDLPSIRNLRLVSRSLAAKATQDRFKSFFRTKRLDVTKTSIESFIAVTKPGLLGNLIEDLTINGVVNNPHGLELILRKKARAVTERRGPMFMSTEHACTPEELAKAQRDLDTLRQREAEYEVLHRENRDVALLAEAFRNLKANSKTGILKILHLEVVVFREDAEERMVPAKGGEWKYIWEKATETYQTVMNALAESHLIVEDLRIFDNDDVGRCSLACNDLHTIDWNHGGLAACLHGVKKLSISLSDRIIHETESDGNQTGNPVLDFHWGQTAEPVRRSIEQLRADANDENNFTGLAKLLTLCPNVEEMDFHYYVLRKESLSTEDYQNHRILQEVATSSCLAKLRGCRLGGMRVRESDLLKVVHRSPIRQLVLEDVQMLDGGRFRSLFDYVTSEEAGMESFLFDDLREGHLLYFEGEQGQAKFLVARGPTGPSTLWRGGENVNKTIRYGEQTGEMLGSPQAYIWRERRRALYGPP